MKFWSRLRIVTSARGPFIFRSGRRLRNIPLVRAALLMLEFALGKLPLPRAGMLLRSPFARWRGEGMGKARATGCQAAEERRMGCVSCPVLLEAAGSCPELQRVLRRVEKQLRKIPREQAAERLEPHHRGPAGSFWLAGRPLAQQP